MTRNGKIARLPKDIREQLNQRIENGEPGTELVAWLNSLTEAQAILTRDFDGRPINEQNLSDWKQGTGYRSWLLQQETLELAQRLSDDADELKQVARVPLSDALSPLLIARLAVVSKGLSASAEDGDGDGDVRLLREFCNDFVALRKGDHSAQRLKLERERLEFDRDVADRKLVLLEKKIEDAQGILSKAELTAEERTQAVRELLGEE